jgi:hypothetical protein
MSKKNRFKKGDFVSGFRFNGEKFVGVYEHEYDCGDHCVSNASIKFCVKSNKIRKATPEEEEEIKETIIKPLREARKKKELESKNNQENFELDKESTEELASEAIE